MAAPRPTFHESQAALAAEAQALGLTELMTASALGNLGEVCRLISAGEDVNARSPSGATALIYATRNDHGNVIRALLNAGADASLRTELGTTAHSLAVKVGAASALAVLSSVIEETSSMKQDSEITSEKTVTPVIVADDVMKPKSSKLMRQGRIVSIGLSAASFLVLFPPHLRPIGTDTYVSAGFAFILSPPLFGTEEFSAIINVPLLAVLLIFLAATTGVLAWSNQINDA